MFTEGSMLDSFDSCARWEGREARERVFMLLTDAQLMLLREMLSGFIEAQEVT